MYTKMKLHESIDEDFNEENRRFLLAMCKPIESHLDNYVLVKMPSEAKKLHKKTHNAIALSGSVFDNRFGKRMKAIFVEERWLNGIRKRWTKGDIDVKKGISDTIQHILLHEKAHSIGIISERLADKYAKNEMCM